MHGLSELKLIMKWLQRVLIINDLSMTRGLLKSVDGKEFQILGSRQKYELRSKLFAEYLAIYML